EVPTLVVRLEPRAAAVLDQDRRLLGADGRPLPIDGRAPGGRARLPLPRRAAGTKPLAAARQVAARDPALHPARLPLDRRGRGGDHRLVRDPLHRPLSPRPIRLRARGHAMDEPRNRVWVFARDRSLPTVSIESLAISRCWAPHRFATASPTRNDPLPTTTAPQGPGRDATGSWTKPGTGSGLSPAGAWCARTRQQGCGLT